MDYPLGYINRNEFTLEDIKGEQIHFRDLQNMVGKKVLLEMPRQSAVDYRIVEITWFKPDAEDVYSGETYEPIGKTDKAGINDHRGRKKSYGSISEMYTRGGRYDDDPGLYPWAIFRLKGENYG